MAKRRQKTPPAQMSPIPHLGEVFKNEVPPGSEQAVPFLHPQNGNQDGFALLSTIYHFLVLDKPLGLTLLRKYVNEFDIRFYNPRVYSMAAFFSFVLDFLQRIVTFFLVVVVLLLLIFAFARGIGIIEFLESWYERYHTESELVEPCRVTLHTPLYQASGSATLQFPCPVE